MPSAVVDAVVFLQFQTAPCTINLTTKDGHEHLLRTFPFIYFGNIVEEFFNAEHIAVVGNRHASHTVANRLIDQFRDVCLAIQDAVLGVDVQVNEVFHCDENNFWLRR